MLSWSGRSVTVPLCRLEAANHVCDSLPRVEIRGLKTVTRPQSARNLIDLINSYFMAAGDAQRAWPQTTLGKFPTNWSSGLVVKALFPDAHAPARVHTPDASRISRMVSFCFRSSAPELTNLGQVGSASSGSCRRGVLCPSFGGATRGRLVGVCTLPRVCRVT